ncbi:hypothetical protein T440DRAFT_473181 [Plenodomus tracheiphilus IPT5]|uniref:Uncharacterized protein n=1 Tax=Plenodomus tracheiphilus IPT5 TaxID=1408161 RepID=A0A6A7ANS5_9PLEO|nr:hypothetical protein T440DRAFT_473181 [Plenodomus tracheiphilus IPT5]
MYMDKPNITEPPQGSWPTIQAWINFNETDQVLDLLRLLPYLKSTVDEVYGDYCEFEDW